MKRFILFISILSIISCQIEETTQLVNEGAIPMTFYAGIEMPSDEVDTKTILGGAASDPYRSILWEYNDEVYVTNETSSSKFTNKAEESSSMALLEGELSEGAKYYAAYPFNIVSQYSSVGVEMILPSIQTYCKDGIASESFPMVAQCNDGIFNFKNLCGIFVLQLLGEQTISSISFLATDANGNYLNVAGKGVVSMDYGDSPNLDLSSSSVKSVILNCPEGVKLNKTTPTSFHIVLPVATYDSFEIIVKTTSGSTMVITSEKPLTVKRSTRILATELSYVFDLSRYGTANSYIVSEGGCYKFNASVKGNSTVSIGSGSCAEVLWESFGTDVKPSEGDLIKNLTYKEGIIHFETASPLKEGNAVIAVKDASGTILWSWHIWITDRPQEHVYPNEAGTMMDRNLGATTSEVGHVGAMGLYYQWGRKDPFLGASSVTDNTVAESTLEWPSSAQHSSINGTIQYSVEHPTTFILDNNDIPGDWLYTRDDTCWGTIKTIYDPCPQGWRIPDGGPTGFWKIAGFGDLTFDEINHGISYTVNSSTEAWFPAAGQKNGDELSADGTHGKYANTTINAGFVYRLSFSKPGDNYAGGVSPHAVGGRSVGYSVRCIKDINSSTNVDPEYIDLSNSGTANSYIVSKQGNYKFNASVKGNSLESIGEGAFTEVLWESFGTDVAPAVGELITDVVYANGEVRFSTAEIFKKGNAMIAVKDVNGNILWSWHIWLTDQPEEQVYYNNAGTMMDRNLGATSATPGDVGALGLLYQWGRKDPFLSSGSIDGSSSAASTTTWPSAVSSSSSTGTIIYSIQHPTVFISGCSYCDDWCYVDSSSGYSAVDFSRWAPSDSPKTIYDPCPVGWRVSDGVWTNAAGGTTSFTNYPCDNLNNGINFSNTFADASIIWYPFAGYIEGAHLQGNWVGKLLSAGYSSCHWSASPTSPYAYHLECISVELDGTWSCVVDTKERHCLSNAYSVRCVKE